MKRSRYQKNDFDFAVIHAEKANVFYVIPIEVFVSYGSDICFVETKKRQRKPRYVEYREAWTLILQWAAERETSV